MKNGPHLDMKGIKARYDYRAVCLIGSTNGDFIDFQGRLTNADRHALAIFAAYTDTKI